MNKNCVKNVSKLIGISAYLNVHKIQEGFVIDSKFANSIKCEIGIFNDQNKFDTDIKKLINPLYILHYEDLKQMFIMIENTKDSKIAKQVKMLLDTYSKKLSIKIIEFPESKVKESDNIILVQEKYPVDLVNCVQFIPIRFMTSDEICLANSSAANGQPFTKINISLENILNTIFSCTDFGPPQYISYITGNQVTGPTYTYKCIR